MKRWAHAMFVCCLGLMLLAAARPAMAQGRGGPPELRGPEQKAGEIPKELENIGIEDKSGVDLPRDLKLVGTDGRSIVLGEYMDGERPLILVLAYYGCPMLCSMVLNGAIEGLKGVAKVPGKDFRVLVVSFDPRDTSDVGHEKRANYLEALGKPVLPIDGSVRAAFEFATGDEAEVRRLADTVGFQYRWDEEQRQYAHAAGLFVITPKGKLSTTLTGITFPSSDIEQALTDASQGVWHSPLKSVLLYCFQYNPHTGQYVLLAGRAMRVGAAITMGVLALFILRLFRAERRKKASLSETNLRAT